MPNRLILLDAYSMIYRAYHALPPMSTSQGMATHAVYGLANMLPKALNSSLALVLAAFDLGKPAFRSDVYPGYKQTRKSMPDDLRTQIALCQKLLEVLSIPCLGVNGFEADDVIGTVSRMAEKDDLQVRIVSGDLDCLQLVSEKTEVMVPRRGISDTVIYGVEEVHQRYGLEPLQMIDFKALRGDASDNVAGVSGVGDKTATRLLQQFGSVENLLERLDELPAGRIKSSLEQHADQLRLAKEIVTIRRDVPLEFDFETAWWPRYNLKEVADLFRQLEFRNLIHRLPAPQPASVQGSLPLPKEDSTTENFKVVDSLQTLEAAISELSKERELAIEGLWEGPLRSGGLFGIAVAGVEQGWYVTREFVSSLLEALSDHPLLAHNLSDLELVLRSSFPEIAERLNWSGSIALAAYLIGEGGRDPSLGQLALHHLDISLSSFEQLRGKGKSARSLNECSTEECASHAVSRARAVLALHPKLWNELRSAGMDYLFREIELPLVDILVEMEEVGIALDVGYLRSMQGELNSQLQTIEADIYQLVGREFNLNAPKQLAQVLFEELELPSGRKTKTGYSTDAEILEGLREKHPVIPKVLEHRQLSKLKSTYVDPLPDLIDANTGRLHTSWNQVGTATGRLSSSNPNLMNIPLRTEEGRRIRRAFQAGKEDNLLFSADYSQIDLRVAAHLSEDPSLLAAFSAGDDVHAVTAARIFKIPLSEVSPEQRRVAKIANFGSIYGQGEYGLSTQTGMPREEARAFLKEYWDTYQHLGRWLEQVRRQAGEHGLVVSATGRRRSLPDLHSDNYQLRQAAERMAINFPIQSLTADIIKIAMVNLGREMKKAGVHGQLLLQVHDELLFEIPKAELAIFTEMVPRVMTEAYELLCGLEVDMKWGPNWAQMQRSDA